VETVRALGSWRLLLAVCGAEYACLRYVPYNYQQLYTQGVGTVMQSRQLTILTRDVPIVYYMRYMDKHF
jgi:hypothetical protein